MPNDVLKVTILVGHVRDNTITGPYFSDQTVNGQTYLQMVDHFVVPKLAARYGQGRNGSLQRLWWMQDGALTQCAIPMHLKAE